MKQKDVFLDSEGDAWFQRNAAALGTRKLPDQDPLLTELLSLPAADIAQGRRVLEIGCGDGTRLAWLRENRGFVCHGVEPSQKAVAVATSRGIDARQGTAENLPFEDAQFDFVLFGFCLYLCDRSDLFRVASEADRVLRSGGWLMILDFYSPVPLKRTYHHRAGLFSHKMDYASLFTWSPSYQCYTQKVRHHSDGAITHDPNEWVATSVLRKNLDAGE